jgi:hypothetical protein
VASVWVHTREQLKDALFLLEFEFSELTLELTVSQDVSRLISDRLKGVFKLTYSPAPTRIRNVWTGEGLR